MLISATERRDPKCGDRSHQGDHCLLDGVSVYESWFHHRQATEREIIWS